MSSTLSVPQWFGAGDLSRHAREFGFTFVGDDDDLVKQEYHPSLPPIPPLIPLGEAGRMKQVSVVDNNNIDSDDSGVRFSADEPGSYGGVIMVNSGEHGGGVEEEEVEDAEKLLRLFGGGDVSDSSVCSSATDGHHHHHHTNNNNNNKVPCAEGGSGCTVVLNTLPTDLLRSLSTDGRISVERLGRTSQSGDQPSDSAGEVRSLVQELVSAVERGENNQAEATGARQRRRPLLPQHHTRIDCDEESRDSFSSHLAGVVATTVATTAVAIETPTTTTRGGGGSSNNNSNKVRHRKSDSPRKAIRRRRERRSSSSGGKKRRKRSTSCSTTSSNCSNASSLRHHHRHHRKHRHRRRSPEVAVEEPPPTPRVNPIFVWIKQDDTRIVEVLCEDYDKRNRIRLTKTAHGWRAIPRTERLASASSSATVVSDEQQPPAVAAAAVVPTAAEKQQRASECVPAPAASSGTDSSRIEAPPTEEQQVDCSLTDGETADQNNDELVSTIHDNHMSTVIEEDECDNQDETKEDEDEGVCEDEEALPEGDEQLMEMAEEEQLPDELLEGEEEDDMPTEEQIVNNCEYADGEGEVEFEEPVMEEDCVEEDLTPTDLSIPKIRDDNQSTPIPKVVPRCMSTVILPVVQSPQPRLSPSQSFPPAPAHQPKTLHKSMFLESLLSSPRKCHEASRRLSLDVDKGPEPLDLGVSSARGAGSPTVSCSDESRKTARPLKDFPEGEPKPKRLKVEDITLKNLLSRQPNASLISPEIELSLASKKEEMTESGRKSRLLELLTSEPAPASISPSPTLDPLTQLKKVLSDPDITVPDPLLVPRNRLQELVANPAKEIPRLLALRPELRLPEALAYPTLLRDPDLLVVSLSHLQHLLQKPDKNSKEDDTSTYSTLGTFLEWQRYQNQQQAAAVAKEILDSQLKQQQHQQHQQHQHQQQQQQQELDAATAAALNQMLWMPYLSQLEAAAVQCGNNQEFLAMLNAVFPSNYPSNSGQYPFVAGVNPAAFNIASTDYKSQMELQQALALWHEAMIQASASAANNNNNNSSNNNNNNRLSKTVSVTNNVGKHFTSSSGRYPQAARKFNTSSARTSPVIHNNFHSSHPLPQQQQQQQQQRNVGSNHLYMPSNGYGTASQLHQQYNLQRCRTNGGSNTNLAAAVKHLKQEDKSVTPRSSVNGSSLMNVLSIPRRQDVVSSQHQSKQQQQQQQQHSHLLAALGKSSNLHQQNNDGIPQLVPLPQPLDLSGATPAPSRKTAPKLKVKQHLIDPSITPKLLLKDDPPPEVGSTTNHPHLWHPLFGSQKTSLNSPWRWTTVTVNGE